MKKIIAMLLCLTLLGCCAAFAENPEKESIGMLGVRNAFNIRCKLPDGYQLSVTESDSLHIMARVTSGDENAPVIRVSIAHNEEYTEYPEDAGENQQAKRLRLNDVSDEVLEEIKESFADSIPDAEFQVRETAHGTKLLIVTGHVDEDHAVVVVYSIYNSYEIEVVAIKGQNAEDKNMTEEQIQMIVDFLSEMDFESV